MNRVLVALALGAWAAFSVWLALTAMLANAAEVTVGGKVWSITPGGGSVTVEGRDIPVVCCTARLETDGTHVVVTSQEFGTDFTTIIDADTEQPGRIALSQCRGDFNHDGLVTVDEICDAVTNASDDCGRGGGTQ